LDDVGDGHPEHAVERQSEIGHITVPFPRRGVAYHNASGPAPLILRKLGQDLSPGTSPTRRGVPENVILRREATKNLGRGLLANRNGPHPRP
jgi:hypothetical protein